MNALSYWLFHLPNYLLAALMYTCVGRFVLSFAFAPDSSNYIWRAFVRLTDPLLGLVRAITPAVVPFPILLIFAVLWLWAARMALFAALLQAGILPGLRAS